MTTAVVSGAVAQAAVVLDAVTALVETPLTSLSDDELLQVMRLAEQARRRLEAFDQTVIAEAQVRALPGKFLQRSTARFLAGVLNLSPTEAAARVRHAHYLGPRVALTGDPLEPLLPVAATARAAGTLSSKQVDVIIAAIKRLDSSPVLGVDVVAEAETFLVEQAGHFDATSLSVVAQRLVDTLDPDGTLADEKAQRARRFVSLAPTGHGTTRISGELDAETAAMAMAVLHSLAAPKRSGVGDKSEPDPRTPGQRMHDAVKSLLRMALRAGTLPRSGGIPATVLITMTAEQFQTGTGLATTSFGQKLTVPQAFRVAGEASIGWVVHNSKKQILNFGRTKRIASESQTLALIARDQGCAFPGCTDPPEWSERHHIIRWEHGGHTNVDCMCLLCDFHHDHLDNGGWKIVMRDGVPEFIPPKWIDPAQKPQRNVRP